MLVASGFQNGDEAAVVQPPSRVQLFVAPWVVALQAPLSMEICRQEYWTGLPSPSPGDLPNPGIELQSPAWACGFFTPGALKELYPIF